MADEPAIDLQVEKAKLIEKAKKDGKIEQREIFKAIADTPENLDILESLYAELAEATIEITPVEEPTAAAFGSALQYVLTLLLSGSMDYRLANVIAIIAASVSNFLANDRWTFRRR